MKGLLLVVALLAQDGDARTSWWGAKPEVTLDDLATRAQTHHGVVIYSALKDLGSIRVANPFPDSYKPTTREVLETLARQTHTSFVWHEQDGGAWHFDRPALPAAYSFEPAKGWKTTDRGLYVACKPPADRTGFDVYQLGTYSFSANPEAGMLAVRDALAFRFIKGVNDKVKLADMKKVAVDGAEALYLEMPVPDSTRTWRQWIFGKDGRAFALVSSLESSAKAYLKDVEGMVRSFKVK